MACPSCEIDHPAHHNCRPLDLWNVAQRKKKARELLDQALPVGRELGGVVPVEPPPKDDAPASIPKPVMQPVKVTDVTVTVPPAEKEHVTVTPVKATVSVTDAELLDKLIEQRDANRKRAREGMRRLRAKKAAEKKNDTN